jgi:hypothetical protein
MELKNTYASVATAQSRVRRLQSQGYETKIIAKAGAYHVYANTVPTIIEPDLFGILAEPEWVVDMVSTELGQRALEAQDAERDHVGTHADTATAILRKMG